MSRDRGRIIRVSVAVGLALGLAAAGPSVTPERRALDYLSREVPRWARENRCYSCHNNGDAARALYEAVRLTEPVAPAALEDTTRWLARPEGWDKNGGDGPFSDKRLARVQFTSALASAIASGAIKDRSPLDRSAVRLAADQDADGSWAIDDGGGTVGSPASYGRPLATLAARDALKAADPARYRAAVARADAWLIARPVNNTLDASVALLASAGRPDNASKALRGRAMERLRVGQGKDGGWGPFADSPPEPFDTALAVLALVRVKPEGDAARMIRRGRTFLVAEQSADGSWPETTRPPGAESYAQRLSTAGWATLALLATRDLER